MGELCLSSTSSKPQFPSLILSDFALFCSFILSHPLYFVYFIFFSPYLLKLLSFLSPLFVTTSLLLLGLGRLHDNSAPKLSEPGASFLLSTLFRAITHRLRPKVEYETPEFHTNLEEFEAYRIVFLFNTSTFDATENPVEENCLQAFDNQDVANLEGKPVAQVESTNLPLMEEKRLQDLFKESEDFENKVEDNTVDPPGAKSNKVVKEDEERSESEAKDINTRDCDNGGEYIEKVMLHSKPLDQNVDHGRECTPTNLQSWRNLGTNIGTYGSMRKEKEWRRTLACKLFEERHNAAFEGDEGIDSLWEAYESKDLSELKPMANATKRNIKKSSKKDYYGDEIEEDEEEFEMTDGQLCCLQAVKFSAGKMNLGMGRPNLVRISKALKRINWLHRVKRNKERF